MSKVTFNPKRVLSRRLRKALHNSKLNWEIVNGTNHGKLMVEGCLVKIITRNKNARFNPGAAKQDDKRAIGEIERIKEKLK